LLVKGCFTVYFGTNSGIHLVIWDYRGTLVFNWKVCSVNCALLARSPRLTARSFLLKTIPAKEWMEAVMTLARIIVRRRIVCALTLALALTLAAGTAHAVPVPVDGSIIVSAFSTSMNGLDLASSTQFTPLSPAPLTMFMFSGTGDLTAITDMTIATASGPLDTNTPIPWTFSTPEGTWETVTFDMDISDLGTGYLDFFLTGTYTPDGAGPLAHLAPASAELRISLNQSGPVVSWGGSMTMTGPVIPEPATMSLLGLGGLALLRRKRRK
jgi:hypothetical protein